jgi:hypothetical protein
MAELNYWTVDQSNKYLWKFTPIASIEEVGDDFFTEEEMKEMTGRIYFPKWEFDHIFDEKVKAALTSWKEKLIANGKKSITCTDTDLIELFTVHKVGSWKWSEVGIIRSGSKILLKRSEQKDGAVPPNKLDCQWLVNIIINSINKKIGSELKLQFLFKDIEGSLMLLKKLIEWDELDLTRPEWIDDEWKDVPLSEQDVTKLKMIWDNPSMFNKKEK